jgi:predicted RNA-binding Zn-ribbon protein involved in translation (DUF1610 family)
MDNEMKTTIEEHTEDGPIVVVRLDNGDEIGTFKPMGDPEIHCAYINRMIQLCIRESSEQDADVFVDSLAKVMSVGSARGSMRSCATCLAKLEPARAWQREENGAVVFYCEDHYKLKPSDVRDRAFWCPECRAMQMHRWQPSPEAGQGWRCSECNSEGECPCRNWVRQNLDPDVVHHPACDRAFCEACLGPLNGGVTQMNGDLYCANHGNGFPCV